MPIEAFSVGYIKVTVMRNGLLQSIKEVTFQRVHWQPNLLLQLHWTNFLRCMYEYLQHS